MPRDPISKKACPAYSNCQSKTTSKQSKTWKQNFIQTNDYWEGILCKLENQEVKLDVSVLLNSKIILIFVMLFHTSEKYFFIC